MQVVVTGVAGFIGYHAARALLDEGARVIGIDNLSPYYDVALKRARLDVLAGQGDFTFVEGDISERGVFEVLRCRYPQVSHVLHLAAQAGVRQSVHQPEAYIASNITGQLQVLEYAASLDALEHMVYASSSSVYGGDAALPFKETAASDTPLSFYGVTKRSGELMAEHYHKSRGLPVTGLRLFTSYGSFGRPDMAYYHFTQALYAGEEITLYNHGDMQRDFTYVSDTVDGVLAALRLSPQTHGLINIGNNHPETISALLALLEQETGRKARIRHAGRHPAEPVATCADISRAEALLHFSPKIRLADGIPRFVAWFCDYHGVS
jgi:UDP-glucuronate 4-epimerase